MYKRQAEADAERVRAAVEPAAGEDDVKLALVTLRWAEAGRTVACADVCNSRS